MKEIRQRNSCMKKFRYIKWLKLLLVKKMGYQFLGRSGTGEVENSKRRGTTVHSKEKQKIA